MLHVVDNILLIVGITLQMHSLKNHKYWNILYLPDDDIQESVFSMFNEYKSHQPENDQLIVEEHYFPVTKIFDRMRSTLVGVSRINEEVMEDAVMEHFADQPERKIKRMFNILNKAHKYIEPRRFESITGSLSGLLLPDICVTGSNCHYKKDFLLKWVGDLIIQQTPLPGRIRFVPLSITTYDHLSSTKAIPPINLRNLEKMNIIDLVSNIVYNNKVIYCTVVMDGFLMGSFHTVVEDEFGQCAKLCINNITTELQAILKTGVKIAIANPYYKISECDQFYFIRVESPDEIVVLDALDNSNETSSGDEHKTEGNKYFKAGDYEKAIRCYTRAIATGDPHTAVYYNNRTICYFKKQKFEESLHDAEAATKIDPKSSKYQYRLALAWSALGNHEKSVNILSGITLDNTDILSREKKLLANSRGKIDLSEMAATARRGEEIDIADYIGPIEISTSQKKGHCIVCTRDIKRGEVISVTKAIAYVGPNKRKTLEDHKPEYTLYPDHISLSETGCIPRLFKSLMNTIIRSKLSAYRIFSLYNKHLHDPIQTELYGSEGYELVRDKDKPTYQTQQIRTIIQTCVHGYPDPAHPIDEYLITGGLWLIRAYTNHSCCSNTFLTFYRDVCVITANCDITAGTELTTARIRITDYAARSKLLKTWNYTCDCKLCEFESDPKNEDLLERIRILRGKADKITDEKHNPEYYTLGHGHYKLLDEAFSLAEEMQLGPNRFNVVLFQFP